MQDDYYRCEHIEIIGDVEFTIAHWIKNSDVCNEPKAITN